jgi:glucose dehydrogenase
MLVRALFSPRGTQNNANHQRKSSFSCGGFIRRNRLVAGAQQAKRVDDTALRNAAKNPDEWITYGRDYAETHYSPLKQIDISNVNRLGLAWYWDTESPRGGRLEGTPLVSNGVIYGSLAWDVLFAVDAHTGAFKWRWDPEIPREHISQICCGPVNRGLQFIMATSTRACSMVLLWLSIRRPARLNGG